MRSANRQPHLHAAAMEKLIDAPEADLGAGGHGSVWPVLTPTKEAQFQTETGEKSQRRRSASSARTQRSCCASLIPSSCLISIRTEPINHRRYP
jgi:hypothetical protein